MRLHRTRGTARRQRKRGSLIRASGANLSTRQPAMTGVPAKRAGMRAPRLMRPRTAWPKPNGCTVLAGAADCRTVDWALALSELPSTATEIPIGYAAARRTATRASMPRGVASEAPKLYRCQYVSRRRPSPRSRHSGSAPIEVTPSERSTSRIPSVKTSNGTSASASGWSPRGSQKRSWSLVQQR